MADALEPPSARGAPRAADAAVDRAVSRARAALRRDGRARDPLPARPRPEPRAAHRRPRASCPKGRASRSSPQAAPGDDPLAAAFGSLGTTDQARYLASLYVDDLADAWRDGIDPRFELARYGERLAASAPTFEPLEAALLGEPTLVDEALDELTRELVARHRPDVVGMSAPFPGNVYGAFRMARVVRAAAPDAKLVLGGGWVNTELRALREPRVFDYFDYVTLDDGERPLLNLLARLAGRRVPLVRTYVRKGDAVVLETDATQHDFPAQATPARRPTTAYRSRTTCPCSRC